MGVSAGLVSNVGLLNRLASELASVPEHVTPVGTETRAAASWIVPVLIRGRFSARGPD